jgi:purine nucleoside permease
MKLSHSFLHGFLGLVYASPVKEALSKRDVVTVTSINVQTTTLTTSCDSFSSPLTEEPINTISIPDTDESDVYLGLSKYGIFKNPYAHKPKVMIVSMFGKEAITTWYTNMDFVHNITVPGLSPLFPWVHCTEDYEVCQFITGESEINAAATVTAITLSPLFDLSETYFLIAGIAGGEPSQVTLGSVTFAEYAVQVALEYQIDSKEVPESYNWTTGYFPFDTDSPLAFPESWYGSEIFRVNPVLRDRAFDISSSKAVLANGTSGNAAFRALYDYAPANELPTFSKCDVLTSDTYWAGDVLSFYFGNLTQVMTNGSATYCATAQEDNATLESMMRAHLFGLVDYSRIIIMRTISDFARAPPSLQNDTVHFFKNVSQGGSSVAITNIWKAGYPIVQDILENWDELYGQGAFSTDEYLGDVFGTLGGVPTFGSGNIEKAIV